MPNSVRIVKRLFDILVSFFVMVAFSPIWLLIALFIKIDSRGPIFYKQPRVKRCGSYDFGERCMPKNVEDTFQLYKFRTMVQDAEKDGIKYPTKNDARVTRIGNFLRKTRLDEIPNFINVFLGHMSVVGPRAERFEILENVAPELPYVWERTRFVKPGITGLAQIELQSDGTPSKNNPIVPICPDYKENDSGELAIRYKLYYDFAYQMKLTNFWSFVCTDLRIMIRTPIIMFIKRNTI